MIRQKILTFLGISLAFAIAWGGWVFTSRFIIAQSDALLTETGSVLAFANLGPMPLPAPAPENESEDEEEPYQEMYFNLSDTEIISVLRNWESRGHERPHEPSLDQISIGQAIDIGREALQGFYTHGLLSRHHLQAGQFSAFLSQNITPGQGSFLDSRYSYWTVSLANEYIRATITINALTGQVWNHQVGFFVSPDTIIQLSHTYIESILDEFMAKLGISNYESTDFYFDSTRHAPTASRSFADGQARAVFSAQGRHHIDEIEEGLWWISRSFELWLTVQ